MPPAARHRRPPARLAPIAGSTGQTPRLPTPRTRRSTPKTRATGVSVYWAAEVVAMTGVAALIGKAWVSCGLVMLGIHEVLGLGIHGVFANSYWAVAPFSTGWASFGRCPGTEPPWPSILPPSSNTVPAVLANNSLRTRVS